MSSPTRRNRLAGETSPYLLQHAENPVDWHPWGPEALERARRENKPILLSIGYAACHWCHVMERESFENEDIARVMNEHFVCVKVDREERPDLDDIYMSATVALSGQGGWPMTVFLTPEQEPFFAGTYFPPEDKYGRPGFMSLLRHLAELWETQRDSLLEQAAELTAHVRAQSQPARPAPVDASAIAKASEQLARSFDEQYGGFTPAPKFPPSANLRLLLRHHDETGDERLLTMVTTTLDAMKNGGIYDHVAGGFCRYSTDEHWLVPHFEKMLYDNAQLSRAYLEAYQVTGNGEYRRVSTETLDYVIREMQAPDGGFHSATDADSEGEEGKFYVWTPDQVRAVVGEPDATRAMAVYDITPDGNWEGKSIPHRPRAAGEVAEELGIDEAELAESVERARAALYAARQKREQPLLDDKILTAWNGLMIGSMAEGYRVLRDPRYLVSAERAASYVLDVMKRPDGGLYRTARGGKAHLDAYLEDYAFLTEALLDLYEASGQVRWLDEANRLARRMLADFADDAGGAFFHTAHQHEPLVVRTREGHDGATPNPNSAAAQALARLSYQLDRGDLREHAERVLRAYGRLIDRQPRAFPTALAAADLLLEGPVELVIAGTRGEPDFEALARTLAEHYLPNRIVGIAPPDDTSTTGLTLPLLEGKTPIDGRAALYVCRDFTCQAPITDPASVAATLKQDAGARRERRRHALTPRALPGGATPGATAAYAKLRGEALDPSAFTRLGETGLTVSRLGFGGYRIDDGAPEHRAALAKALREGVNLIDTSTNYTDGRSERLVGEALAELCNTEDFTRDQVVVVSKIGYVQGANLEVAEARKAEGKPFPEMVEYGDGIWHCMHPSWLDDQLSRSLDRLALEQLDVCLIHNPEYFFSDAVKRGKGPLSELRDEFYRRLGQAFAHFEAEVSRGRIGCYGVSSNTLVAPHEQREATNLQRMVAAAEQAGGKGHHFRVVQLPMNLVESGAVFADHGEGQSVLDVAADRKLAVLVNRPLNAIVEHGLIRLADVPSLDDAPPFDAQLARVDSLEAEFRRNIAAQLSTAPGSAPASSLFAWADQLAKLPARVESLEQWRDIEAQIIGPRVAHAARTLDQALDGEIANVWREWRGRYLPELEKLLAAVRQRAAAKSKQRVAALAQAVDTKLAEPGRSGSLSQKALWTLRSTAGVSCVLVGMRRPEYVADAVATLSWPALDKPRPVLEAVAALGLGA